MKRVLLASLLAFLAACPSDDNDVIDAAVRDGCSGQDADIDADTDWDAPWPVDADVDARVEVHYIDADVDANPEAACGPMPGVCDAVPKDFGLNPECGTTVCGSWEYCECQGTEWQVTYIDCFGCPESDAGP